MVHDARVAALLPLASRHDRSTQRLSALGYSPVAASTHAPDAVLLSGLLADEPSTWNGSSGSRKIARNKRTSTLWKLAPFQTPVDPGQAAGMERIHGHGQRQERSGEGHQVPDAESSDR